MKLNFKNSVLYVLAAVLGGAQALSFAPVPSGLLQMFSLAGMLLLLPSAMRPMRLAFVFGLAWFCAGLYWLHFSMHGVGGLPTWMSVLAIMALSSYLAMYYALALVGWRRFFAARRVSSYLVAFPALWLVAELARGYVFGGFPWLASGYAHIDNPLLKGWFAIFGVYGVGFAAAMCAGALAFVGRCVIERQREVKGLALAGASMAVFAVLGLIVQGLNWGEKAGAPISVNIAQPNVAQTNKFDEQVMLDNTLLFINHAAQSQALLTIFPETALPYPWTQVPIEPLEALHNRLNGRAVLMGGVGIDDAKHAFYNSAMWLNEKNDPFDPPRYDKIHLLPFGEMIPWGFQWFVDAMHIPLGGYGYGQSRKPFDLTVAGQTTRVGVNICYENEFGEELIQAWAGNNGDAAAPNVWVNMSNLGWFGTVNQSTAQEQHLYMSRARALEMARPVIVATNTGMSAYIDASGTVVKQLRADAAVSATVQVQGMQGLTPYIGWGNAPMLGLASLLFGLSVFLRHRVMELD